MPKRRILIIDDEQGFTRLVKLYLEETGRYEVQAESRGAHGVAAAREFHPDLILLDIIMPDLDGASVAAQLREDAELRDIPVLFLTAMVSREETGAQSRVIGGNPFLAKPQSMEMLIACIEQQLGSISQPAPRR